jgi:hypothetical protein
MPSKQDVLQFWASLDNEDYERRVQEYEEQGICRSDAQAIVEAEMMQE